MTDSPFSLADLAAEEEELQFSRFTNDDAWELGSTLVAAGRAERLPIAVEISRNHHRLFHVALTGTSPDNASWIERKTRVVNRFGHSSLYVRQASLEKGTTFEEEYDLDPALYAAHGGAVPIIVRSVGPIGVAVVSGLPQFDDHRMVVAALRAQIAAG